MSEKLVELCKFKNGTSINNENYADEANKRIDAYKNTNNGKMKVTTSKLRKMYAQITNVYTRVTTPDRFEEAKGEIQYLKVKMAYESGRDKDVADFLNATLLLRLLDFVNSFEKFQLYCRYAESVVAYFKYYGGRD
jgi:CRISPR-associated protein Csm2